MGFRFIVLRKNKPNRNLTTSLYPKAVVLSTNIHKKPPDKADFIFPLDKTEVLYYNRRNPIGGKTYESSRLSPGRAPPRHTNGGAYRWGRAPTEGGTNTAIGASLPEADASAPESAPDGGKGRHGQGVGMNPFPNTAFT